MKTAIAALSLFFASAVAAAELQLPGDRADYERILVPVLANPVSGVNGSYFETELRLAATQTPVTIYGVYPFCHLLSPGACPPQPLIVQPNEELDPQLIEYDAPFGRFAYVLKDQLHRLSASLRVYDTSRSATNYGTSIPLVRESEFRTSITFPGVPTDTRFRNRLRIYTPDPWLVFVTIGNGERIGVRTQRVLSDSALYAPAVAEITGFPVEAGHVRVTIEPDRDGPVMTVWALLSITNNDLQTITILTPEP